MSLTDRPENQQGNLSTTELDEYKELVSTPTHLLSNDRITRKGELIAKANYWDHVAISPPSEPTNKVLGELRNVNGELRAYSSSAHYGAEEHSGVDPDNDGSDSDTFYYFVPENLREKAQSIIDDTNIDHEWLWLTVKAAPLGEPAGPLVGIGADDS